ncbi:probable G-protein coupled receptor 139 [Callorhinchus milii]|uniref:probable G-protein coupled receptor 139 n=1 Tax=Callorhinchus milii TaxID=7868 RepID=UPI000457394F|nr:probable G-protein coupled receptor 139 [Callorhinchus milii]|eukprot:gi/632971840/ref/XP_007902368.1/ PREDICTED: tachykinin-like peptides receptor 86C [Callorhinchus milii]
MFVVFPAAIAVTIVILAQGMCGLSKCVNRYLVAMAISDLLVIFIGVILRRTFLLHLPYLPLFHTPVCSLNLTLRFFIIDISVWLTVAFTFDRFIAICCTKLKTKYCTEWTARLMIWAICTFLCVENIPVYFVYQPQLIVNGQPWYCTIKPSFYVFPAWRVFGWLNIILNPLLPFILILLFNTLTIRHVLVASRVRQGLRGSAKGRDEEMESRRKSIILLFTISGSYVLLWLTFMVIFMYSMVTETQPLQSDYNSPFTIAEHVGYMLQLLSSCTNTVIYGVTQTQFRQRLKYIFSYPITRLLGHSHNHV